MASDSKEYDLAIAALTSVLRAKPDAGDLYLHLAAVYRAKGDAGSAVAALRKAAEVAPGSEEANLLLARLLLETGQTREAARVFQATMHVDPNDATAVLRRISELLWGSGVNVAMVDAFTAVAAKLLPQDAAVADGLGWTYYLKLRPALAEPFFEKAVTASPGTSAYHYHWGLAAMQNGDRKRAHSEFQSALECHPTGEERRQIESAAAAAERTFEMKKQ
jgi:tetratricopeptide (TPR) repeat protein